MRVVVPDTNITPNRMPARIAPDETVPERNETAKERRNEGEPHHQAKEHPIDARKINVHVFAPDRQMKAEEGRNCLPSGPI